MRSLTKFQLKGAAFSLGYRSHREVPDFGQVSSIAIPANAGNKTPEKYVGAWTIAAAMMAAAQRMEFKRKCF